MAINKNHEFEDLDNTKCSIVEKNVSASRVEFLKEVLTFNKYEVVVVASPAPKEAPTSELVAPSTFTVGVTDLRFNSTNAVFGRSLHTPDGHVVTLAYWNQEDTVSDDTVPYFNHKK